MRILHAALAILFGAVTASGCTLGSASETESQAKASESTTASTAIRGGGLVKSFEFLGCSGDWTDEGNTPDVWQTGSERGTYFLVRHADTCGYTIGSNPEAEIRNGSLELSYELSNTTGMLAACPCEFWAKFELTDTPNNVKRISVNGVEARLKGSLAER